MQVSVIGGGLCSEEVARLARELGRKIAERGHVLICGGRSGVMEAACQGARMAGGIAVGILPGSRDDANPYLDVMIDTGMGIARNAIVARSGDVVVALPGGVGTLSEIAIALKMGRTVISLDSWDVPGVMAAASVEEAVYMIESVCGSNR
ncbi:MAG: TIGR00725 family protein [Methanotrichaceae archaeon]|nr:TIGR00725 family protein [Methanotrichaceae archaeon]